MDEQREHQIGRWDGGLLECGPKSRRPAVATRALCQVLNTHQTGPKFSPLKSYHKPQTTLQIHPLGGLQEAWSEVFLREPWVWPTAGEPGISRPRRRPRTPRWSSPTAPWPPAPPPARCWPSRPRNASLARFLARRSSPRTPRGRGSSCPGASARWPGRRRRWTPWPSCNVHTNQNGFRRHGQFPLYNWSKNWSWKEHKGKIGLSSALKFWSSPIRDWLEIELSLTGSFLANLVEEEEEDEMRWRPWHTYLEAVEKKMRRRWCGHSSRERGEFSERRNSCGLSSPDGDAHLSRLEACVSVSIFPPSSLVFVYPSSVQSHRFILHLLHNQFLQQINSY